MKKRIYEAPELEPTLFIMGDILTDTYLGGGGDDSGEGEPD